MARCKITDILSFREDINSSRILLRQQFEPVKAEILHRFADTEQRIASADDTHTLQKLDAFKKFLKSISEQFDLQHIFIDRNVDGFNGIDDVYWNTVFNGQKLADENENLKATIENLKRQREILIGGWRADRNRWDKDRIIKRKAA